jgi:Zn-finger nucleic acid-binding protein
MTDVPRHTLACPHCGAPLPPSSLHGPATCAFCGITSEPATPGAGSSPTSGQAGALPATALSCPRCKAPLFAGDAGGAILQGCGLCGGIWLDNDSARKALSNATEEAAALAARASSRASSDVSVAAPVACPVCARGLVRRKATRHEVLIDVCNEHGTWFDRYELGLVLDAARPTATQPVAYTGPTPDFHAGANPEAREFASVFATGAAALASGLAMVALPEKDPREGG